MSLSGAGIDNFEKLERAFDAGILKRPGPRRGHQEDAMQKNKVVDADTVLDRALVKSATCFCVGVRGGSGQNQ